MSEEQQTESELVEVTIAGQLKRTVVETLETDLTIRKADIVKYLVEELDADEDDLKDWDCAQYLLTFVESEYFANNILPEICTLDEWQRDEGDHTFDGNDGQHPYIKVTDRVYKHKLGFRYGLNQGVTVELK